MDSHQPTPLPPWPGTPDPPRPRERRCLWLGAVGCLSLLVLGALLAGIVVLLAKFVWGLRLDQWL